MEDARRHGISLGRLNMNMLIVAILVSILLFFTMQRTQSLYNETHKITQEMDSWKSSSYDMQLASDYLTEEIRTFVVTGKLIHLQNYFDEVNFTQRREKALALLEQQQGGKTLAYQNLSDAMEDSVELTVTEYYAARLAAEGYGIKKEDLPKEIQAVDISDQDHRLTKEEKLVKAEDMVYNDVYMSKKSSISSHMKKCLDDLSDEMNQKQEEKAKKLKKQVFGEHLLTIFLIAIMLGIVLLTAKLVIKPLQRSVELIRDEKEIPLEGAYEVQFLAKTYNLMYNTNHISNADTTYEATHDKMTGLYNRKGYEHLLANIDIETSTLIHLDLDNFSQVDHTFGRDIGNKVLIKAGDIIYKNFRAQDYICKLENDEYAVIMIHTDEQQKDLIEKKIQVINEKLKSHEDDIPTITLSAGIAFGVRGTGIRTMDDLAKGALVEAKKKSEGIIFKTPGNTN